MTKNGNKTFVRITNKDIYKKLECIEGKVGNISGTTRWHTWAIGFIVIILAAVIGKVL